MIDGLIKRLGDQCVCLKCHVAKSASYLAVTSQQISGPGYDDDNALSLSIYHRQISSV